MSIIASIGLPLVAKLVRSGLEKIDNPVATTAAKALKNVEETISNGSITPEQIGEANRHIEKMKALDVQERTQLVESVNETMRVEANAKHWWSSAWRPFWGAVSAVAFFICSVGLIFLGGKAIYIRDYTMFSQIVALAGALTTLFAVPGAILGITTWHRGKMQRIQAGERDDNSLKEQLERFIKEQKNKG